MKTCGCKIMVRSKKKTCDSEMVAIEKELHFTSNTNATWPNLIQGSALWFLGYFLPKI